MLKAERSPILQRVFNRYVTGLLRRRFHSVRLCGETEALDREEAYPLILYTNHETWWDGFLLLPLTIKFGQNYRLMMEEKNLRRYWFFRKAGVFGVDLDSGAGRSASLLHAARLLREPVVRRTLILFPQGRLCSPYEPFPEFRDGVSALARLAGGGGAVPVGIRIVQGRYPRPEAFLEAGPILPASTVPDNSTLRAALQAALERLEERHARGDWKRAIDLIPPRGG
jgi:chlorobactene lauroyltransferase